MSSQPINIWDQHGDKLRTGYRVRETPKHDLGVIDPRRDILDEMPEYTYGMLPEVYENMMRDCIAEFGGDPAAYACAFTSIFCAALHASVLYNQRYTKQELLKPPNDHSLTLGRSGKNKSGMLKDLGRPMEPWRLRVSPKRKRGTPRPKREIAEAGSAEGILAQIAANDGERLVILNDEGMGVYRGSGAHHQHDAVAMVSDMVTRSYDGSPYSKLLADEGKSYSIPRCLATFVLSAVFTDFATWEGLPELVSKGALARTTVGMVSHRQHRDPSQRIAGAEAAFAAMVNKVHALRDVRFVMTPEAAARWDRFIDNKEAQNEALEKASPPPGLLEWASKYDTRILSTASALAAIAFVEGDCKDYEQGPALPKPEGKVESAPEFAKIVRITEALLVQAAQFVERFLLPTQKVFYEQVQGINEFGSELEAWATWRVLNHSADDPGGNVLTRRDLTFKGPACVRPKSGVGVTDALRDKQTRWIRALLDSGYIEVYRPEGARVFRQPRTEEGEANFRIRDEFFAALDNEEFKAHARRYQARWGRSTLREGETPLGVEI